MVPCHGAGAPTQPRLTDHNNRGLTTAEVRGGEATGEVSATGRRTFFGKTAELVRTAGSANRQEHEIGAVVKNLFVANAITARSVAQQVGIRSSMIYGRRESLMTQQHTSNKQSERKK